MYSLSPVVLAHVRPLHVYKLMPKKPANVYTLKIKEIFKGPPFLKSSLQANVNLTTPAFGFCAVKAVIMLFPAESLAGIFTPGFAISRRSGPSQLQNSGWASACVESTTKDAAARSAFV